MKFFKTIRAQLTFYFALVFGISLCIFSIILYNVFAKQNRDDLDKAMIILASSISDEMEKGEINNDIFNEIKETFIPFSTPKQQLAEILNEKGDILLKSPQLGQYDLPLEKEWLEKVLNGNPFFKTIKEEIKNVDMDSYGLRTLLLPVSNKSKNYIIVVEIPLSNLEGTLFKFRLILYTAIPLTILLSSILGWLFSKKAYAPINELINNSNLITSSNLDKRLPVNDSGDEVSKLASTLNNMMERLQKSFVVLKQFTSDASHELRTPLTILKGEIEVALNKERTVSEYEKILKGNLEEVERLQKIVDGLLTLSQLESNKIDILHEEINIEELLTEAVAKIKNITRKKNITVILKLSELKEENKAQQYIKGERSMLLNVIINILDNAVKYSNPGGEIICTEILNSSENKILISIKDNGIGISHEKLENIFDRFYRADFSRTRDESNSTGLGLAIAKSVLEAHHGTISVSSSHGNGTTFAIILPLFNGLMPQSL